MTINRSFWIYDRGVKMKTNQSNPEEIVNAACLLDCGGRCPTRIHVKDGTITRIEAGHDYYKACLRGRSYRQVVYHPDRLKYPLKRIGERGAGQFERISWSEAFETVAKEMKRIKAAYGNSAILFSHGAAKGSLNRGRSGYRLMNMFGGCTTTWCNVSNEASIFASTVTYGTMSTGNGRDDLVNSRLAILWGWNPAVSIWDSGTPFAIITAKEAGTKIVVVDPRYTESATLFGHQWIPIIPGTDTAMLIAMANVIIANNLQDQEFLDRYTIGFEKYKDYVMGGEDGIPKTPQWAEPITVVPAGTIEALAKEYASAKPAALFAPWGPGRSAFGEQYHRAAMVLAAMTGNVGIHGGNAAGWERGYPSMLHEKGMPVPKNPVQEGTPPRKNALVGVKGGTNPTSARFHAAKIWDAILEGKSGGYPADLKMLYNMGGDPIHRLPDINRGIKALKTLEFIVAHSQFMYGVVKYADIVFPVNTFYEREDMGSPFVGAPYYVYCRRVIDPLYESKSDVQICTELAERLGIKGYNDKTDEEWMREFVEAMPEEIDFDEFKQNGIWEVPLDEPWVSFKDQIEDPANNPFPTPSGKIEIFSQLLADMNNPLIPPVPKYIEPWEGRNDPLAEKYPLQMINSHMLRRANSVLENVAVLRELTPHLLWISTVDAQQRQINDGDKVRVFNDRGEMVVGARVTERIIPGVVHLPFGGHYTPDENGVDHGGATNLLTKNDHSPGGALCANTCLVEVQRV